MYLHIIYFLKIIIFFSAIIFIGPRKENIKNYEIENKYITNNFYISKNDNDTTYLYTIIALDIRKSKFLKYSNDASFYELDYQRMLKAIALGSKETLKTICILF